ncbi:MAG: 30S ribosomal protein S16 [Planctomycetota bacterium]
MAVVLRLKRIGRKNRPSYRICVMDRRTRRDGRTIEELGHYDPLSKEEGPRFHWNEERVRYWLSVGACPSETVTSFLRRSKIEIPSRARKARRKADNDPTRRAQAGA